jgi:hypothetical protein
MSMTFRWENFWHWLARRLPDPLIYWATIRAGAVATTNEKNRIEENVPEIRFMDVVKWWGMNKCVR